MIYLGGKCKHMIRQAYVSHPPVTYVSRGKAQLCHFIGQVPGDNRKPYIQEIEHVLYTPRLSKNYAAMLKQAPRVEREFHSKNCKGVFVFSDSSLRQISDHIDTTGIEKKLHIVLPAYPDQPDNPHKHSGPFTILTISNKFWGRGIPLAIEVFRELRKKHGKAIRMRLVCNDVPADYALPKGIELIRVKNLDSRPRQTLYREANVFLLLGLMQFGVVLEAMAYGVPTVSTPNFDRGGWIVRGVTGFTVKPPLWHYGEGFGTEWKTWDEFCEVVKIRLDYGVLSYMITEAVEHIELLMDSPALLKQMGQAAQKQQRTKHSFKARNKQVRKIYSDILKGIS